MFYVTIRDMQRNSKRDSEVKNSYFWFEECNFNLLCPHTTLYVSPLRL